jgi:hypothetical protein
MLRKKFEIIKACKVPKLNKTWKCTKFCHHGKNTFEGTNVKPIIEFRDGQVCAKGQTMTQCEQLKFEVERKGIDRVTKEYSAEGFSLSNYANPGEI